MPVSAPLPRGIFATSFADVPAATTAGAARGRPGRRCYEGEPFVRVVARGRQPEVAAVSGSNYVEVGFTLGRADGRAPGGWSASRALDNLVKGGAGPGHPGFNVMMGFDETLTLEEPGLWP